jgi:hypothetical protein
VISNYVDLEDSDNNKTFKFDCSDPSCKFTFRDDIAPQITSVSPATLPADDETITITGTGFGADKAKVKVTIAGTICTISSMTNAQVVCDIKAPGGENVIKVHVTDKGYAVGDVKLTKAVALTSFAPASGSFAGG